MRKKKGENIIVNSSHHSEYTCIECGSKQIKNKEIELPTKWSTKKLKVLTCLKCGGTKIKRHCPNCESLNLVEDELRASIDCRDCGMVLSGPSPYFVGYWKVSYPWGSYMEFQSYRYGGLNRPQL